jgi:hypothetical protein
MKQIIFLAFITFSTASLYAQNTSDPALTGVPQFVNDAYIQASQDVLIGIGTYRVNTDMSNISFAIAVAQTRARADIARQLDSIVVKMVAAYTAQSDLNPNAALSFRESVIRTLSAAELRGAKMIHLQTDQGLLWVVMEYGKPAAFDEAINPAVAAAKLAAPAAAAFDAQARMEDSFYKAAGGGPVPGGD